MRTPRNQGVHHSSRRRSVRRASQVNQYIFYATPDGVPLRFHMMGVNYITDSHPDEVRPGWGAHVRVGLCVVMHSAKTIA